MIKRLRRQLTALFTITTGLILTLVVIGHKRQGVQ